MKKLIDKVESHNVIGLSELNAAKHVVMGRTKTGKPVMLKFSVQWTTENDNYFHFVSLANIRTTYSYGSRPNAKTIRGAAKEAMDNGVELMVFEKDDLANAYLWAIGEDKPVYTQAELFLRRVKQETVSSEAQIIALLEVDSIITHIKANSLVFNDGSKAIYSHTHKCYASAL